MFRFSAAFILLAAATSLASAQVAPNHWVEGKDYFAILNPQPTNQPESVVVTEVFSFACPACNRFEPFLDKLRAELPKGAVLQFVPASFVPTEDWPVFQRAYFTAKALGLDTLASHDAMFKAIWGPNGSLATYDPTTQRPKAMANMPTIKDIANFYAKFGGKPDEFIATANSFAINLEMKRADQQILAWGVIGTPSIVIDNKWRIAGSTPKDMAALTLYMVNQELAAKKTKRH